MPAGAPNLFTEFGVKRPTPIKMGLDNSEAKLRTKCYDIHKIVDACCKAWNSLINEAGRITSIASRKWATNGQ